ncbi:ATP-binding protein [Thiohalocapsa sp. ML1]|uniref:ATP-binding response regulator n=1 Tax=Thiohalocapsa sp. ML1 TaxID=1431688 RepID=UPI0009EB917C|nr:ATP-binding protein [Thiohalocapsa sp. ML1]
MRVPFAMARRLRERVLAHARPCLVQISSAGALLAISGDSTRYGLDGLRPGDDVSHRLPLLIGLDLAALGPEHWPMVELPAGGHADVLLEPGTDGARVLLLDAAAEHDRRVATQQQANERALLNRRLAATLAELEAARAALEAQNRALESLNAAKARFIAGLSHELRTPLTAVLGHAALLRERSVAGAGDAAESAVGGDLCDVAAERSLDAIQSGAQHLLSLVNNVLDHASLETGQLALNPAPMDPLLLLTELERLLAPQAARRGLDFRVLPPQALPPRAETDATRLRQVLINLVNNALKYTEQGFVELRLDWLDGRLTAAVADTGPGVPVAQREHVLRPFHRGATAAAGSGDGSIGLGLAISNELVRLLGGRLHIGDRPGGGAVFGFEIPAPALAPPAGASATTPAAIPLLLVDDAREIQLLYGQILARDGFAVHAALTPAAALTAFDAVRPRIVIVDVHLGDEDGATLISGLRARGFDGVLLAWSASSMLDDRERLLDAGADRYLVKPVPPLELQETLRSLLAERGG